MNASASNGRRASRPLKASRLVSPSSVPADDADDAERADDEDRVEHQVEHDGRHARTGVGLTGLVGGGLDADEDEPGVADRRVGEHPLDVGLHDGEERPDEQREHGEHPDRPAASRRGRTADATTSTRSIAANAAALPADAMNAGHRRRRALVHVGRPHVERHGGDLEAEADEQQRDAGEHQRVVALDRRRRPWSATPRPISEMFVVPTGAVDQGDAVEEERRREAAEHEVLDAGLLALSALRRLLAASTYKRERQRLEAEEQHDQVVGRRHHDAADRGDQVQGVDLGPVVGLAAQVVVGQERHEQQGDADRDRQEHRRTCRRRSPRRRAWTARCR